MFRILAAFLILSIASPALGQDGCGKFKWNLEKERALLTAADAPKIANGADFSALPATALDLKLEPSASVRLARPPERAPKAPNTFSGFVRFGGVPQSQTVLVTLSAEAWIDVVQDDHTLKSAAFSSVHDCPTVRKSVKFDLAAGPFAVQLIGVAEDRIKMTVTPASE